MKVFFIGAGPGAADLITIRGAEILSRAQLVMYAGSLVSEAMLRHCRANPVVVNTAKLHLDEQLEYYRRFPNYHPHANGRARLSDAYKRKLALPGRTSSDPMYLPFRC